MNTLKTMLLGFALICGGCQVAPSSQDATGFNDQTVALVRKLCAENEKIDSLVNTAHGYAIFPVVGEGGLLFAGGWGRGAVYEEGTLVGYARVDEHSIGAVAGGEKWTLLIFFKDATSLDAFEKGTFAWDAKANVVAGETGTSIGTDYSNGVLLMRVDPAGAMGNASAGFSNYSFLSLDEARKQWSGKS
jgi:lipid-binding SYLF domain-containing protein